EATTPRDSLLGVLPLQAADGGEGLYLHAMIADGIEVTGANGQIDEPQTRGSLVEADNFHDSFGVMASVYTGSWNEDSCLPDYMYNVKVTQASQWTTSYYWPGSGQNIRFFAYAPYYQDLRDDESILRVSDKTVSGTPSIEYTVGDKILFHDDLLVAASGEMPGNSSSTVPLTFKHALTAINFVTGDDVTPGRITFCELKGVYASGTYHYASDSWDNQNRKRDYGFWGGETLDGSADQPLTSSFDKWWFFLIPQTLPEDATLEVGFIDDLTGTERTLTASIAGQVWPMGKTVTYRISTSSISVIPTFEVTQPEPLLYNERNTNFSITSYITVSREGEETKTIPLAWTAEFVEEDGSGGYRTIQRPDWIMAFQESGMGGTQSSKLYFAVEEQQGVTSNPHDEVLQSAASVSGTYDLSTKGGTTAMNTANCYAINAPGSYSLPLVYGNAIKEGNENFSAYLFSPQKFVNHLDMAIGNPYIYNNANCTPDDAVLVWQDEENLVTNVRLSPDKHNLIFDVPQATIKQGNAIVAVRDTDSRIMWSWHIWVTDFVPGLDPTVEERYDPVKTPRDKVVTNYQGAQYTFMGANIGWCDAGTTTYDDRSVKVRYRQSETGSTQVITLTQASHSVVNSGNQTYFQFGRKDPMLGAIRDVNGSTVDKTFYPGSYSFDKSGTGKVTIGTSIQKPHVFFNYGSAKPQDWSATTYNNLWHISGPKTIYDPSPVGYQLPLQDAFKGFTYNGNYVSGNYFLSRFNSPYTSTTDYTDNFGWEFYCNKMTGEGSYDTAGGTIFFPALCYRHRENGSVNLLGDTGYYWAASPFSNDEGYSLFFTGTSIWPVNNGRTSGFAVRPVREK
ncbi:fimbrillin family protein, partial [Phocaeicola vulgatus]|uniref:fimbrillin family protein n=1 Tax=Phocaeicola vulgatus TaxID=821 RepID=UPI003DA25218